MVEDSCKYDYHNQPCCLWRR